MHVVTFQSLWFNKLLIYIVFYYHFTITYFSFFFDIDSVSWLNYLILIQEQIRVEYMKIKLFAACISCLFEQDMSFSTQMGMSANPPPSLNVNPLGAPDLILGSPFEQFRIFTYYKRVDVNNVTLVQCFLKRRLFKTHTYFHYFMYVSPFAIYCHNS